MTDSVRPVPDTESLDQLSSLDVIEVQESGGSGMSDEKVKISSGDLIPGYLESKLVGGTDITVQKMNEGANEYLEILYSGTPVPGPQGDPGAQGDPGPQGDPGSPGADGADGAAGVGVPVGGTTGQVLTKDSGVDFETSWQTPSGGGGLNYYVDSDKPGHVFGDSWIRINEVVDPSAITGYITDFENTTSLRYIELSIPTPTAADLYVLSGDPEVVVSEYSVYSSGVPDSVVAITTPDGIFRVTFGDSATMQDVVDGINAWSITNLGGRSIAALGVDAVGTDPAVPNIVSSNGNAGNTFETPGYLPELVLLRVHAATKIKYTVLSSQSPL
jgi:hypothetical protein